MLAAALVLAALLLSSPVSSDLAHRGAAPETVSLYCGRGADYPDVHLILGAEGAPHELRVVFVDFRPSGGRARWTLRDCLYTAHRLDGSRPIVASLWIRARDRREPRELILQCMTPALQSLSIETPPAPIMPACSNA